MSPVNQAEQQKARNKYKRPCFVLDLMECETQCKAAEIYVKAIIDAMRHSKLPEDKKAELTAVSQEITRHHATVCRRENKIVYANPIEKAEQAVNAILDLEFEVNELVARVDVIVESLASQLDQSKNEQVEKAKQTYRTPPQSMSGYAQKKSEDEEKRSRAKHEATAELSDAERALQRVQEAVPNRILVKQQRKQEVAARRSPVAASCVTSTSLLFQTAEQRQDEFASKKSSKK